uniref:Uncharacterized protein n=1 Tax=Anguilla anguilla TaxID=7936 RepID=A0A0E9VYT4_ANGAN
MCSLCESVLSESQRLLQTLCYRWLDLITFLFQVLSGAILFSLKL